MGRLRDKLVARNYTLNHSSFQMRTRISCVTSESHKWFLGKQKPCRCFQQSTVECAREIDAGDPIPQSRRTHDFSCRMMRLDPNTRNSPFGAPTYGKIGH